METMFPDYDRSILSVASSVLKHYGVKDCTHPGLPEFDAALGKEPKNVIVMLFDGVGSAILDRHLPADSFLRSHKVCDISSVFPPTTTAATTSVETGLSPFEHSWLGWNLYFSELDETVSVFPNKLQRNGKRAAPYNVGGRYIPFKTIFDRIKEADPTVGTHFLSVYSDEKIFSIASGMRKIRRICRRPGRQYIYMYWFEPDHTMHTQGVGSPKVGRIIQRINRNVEKLCAGLTDSAAVVIADHGLIDVKWEYLSDHPEINGLLLRAPSIEPRALSLFVKEGKQDEFARLFNDVYGDRFLLLTKQQVYDKKLFGDGKPGPKTDDFIGDFLAVATSDSCLTVSKWKTVMKANHAGLTREEMTVPFILAVR